MISEWVKRLKQTNKAIIVEGKRDKQALSAFCSNIFILNKPLYQITELIADKYDECIILTDLDKKGVQLYKRLRTDLQNNGVKIDRYFREFLFKNTKLTHIEGLTKCIEKSNRF